MDARPVRHRRARESAHVRKRLQRAGAAVEPSGDVDVGAEE
jgi:hypothetical protein